jgi:hypothetical protein
MSGVKVLITDYKKVFDKLRLTLQLFKYLGQYFNQNFSAIIYLPPLA